MAGGRDGVAWLRRCRPACNTCASGQRPGGALTPPGDAVQCLVELLARCIVGHAKRVCRIGCAHIKMRILPSRSLTLPRPIRASEGQQLHSRLWHTLRRVSQPPELAPSRSNAQHAPASRRCSAAGEASPAASKLGASTRGQRAVNARSTRGRPRRGPIARAAAARPSTGTMRRSWGNALQDHRRPTRSSRFPIIDLSI